MRQPFADAQAALGFVVEQGLNIEPTVYRRKYPNFDYRRHLPVLTQGAPWAIGTMFFSVDVAGQAKWLNGSSTDIPFVNLDRDRHTHEFAMLGSGWEWNLEEVNQAALYGINISADKPLASRQVVEKMLYDVAIAGDDEKGWTGLINDPNVNRADVAGSGTGRYFANKDPDEILVDFNELLGYAPENTGEVEWANTVRLPPAALRDLATRRISAGGDGTMTILDFVKQKNVYTAETDQPLNIGSLRELATASEDGGGRMIAYRNDEEVVRFHLPMPYLQLQPRQKSLMGFEAGGIARTGGTEIRLPGAVVYRDEVTAPPA